MGPPTTGCTTDCTAFCNGTVASSDSASWRKGETALGSAKSSTLMTSMFAAKLNGFAELDNSGVGGDLRDVDAVQLRERHPARVRGDGADTLRHVDLDVEKHLVADGSGPEAHTQRREDQADLHVLFNGRKEVARVGSEVGVDDSLQPNSEVMSAGEREQRT